jgi:hypothetical protein
MITWPRATASLPTISMLMLFVQDSISREKEDFECPRTSSLIIDGKNV